MGKLSVPKAQANSKLKMEYFLGADLSESSSGISFSRSPDCRNMIRESAGKVRKWIGYHTVKEYDLQINGVHFYSGKDGDKRLIHTGTKIYLDAGTSSSIDDILLTDKANDHKSMSRQIGGKLCIFDGGTMWVLTPLPPEGVPSVRSQFVSGETLDVQPANADITYSLVTAESLAKIPITVISIKPGGGGVPYEETNLLSRKKTVQFLSDGASKDYQLPDKDLDSDLLTIKVRIADGSTTNLTEGTDFTVNRSTGKISFKTAPVAPVPEGFDNVFVTYSKTVQEYLDRINKCDICTLYGAGGGRDRLFVSGSTEFGNRDYYSAVNEPTYFGDLSYNVIGSDSSRIMGYSIIGDKLATHLDRSEDDTNVVLREGVLTDNKTVFRLAGSYQGEGAVSKHSFATLSVEPVLATKAGISSVTMTDYSGERYSQSRSYYIDRLLTQQDLSESYACIYDEFYMICAGEYLFALDSRQVAREKNMPYATRQYEGYYRTNVNARILWEQDGRLCFGTKDGKIKEFHTDHTQLASFSDDGTPIHAVWTTPEIYGSDFNNKKKYKRISVLLGAAVATGCRIWAIYDGERELIYDYDGTARYFTYSQFIYSKLGYKTDKTPQMIIEKLSGMKPDGRKVQLVFENDVLNEPFSLYESIVEFKEGR